MSMNMSIEDRRAAWREYYRSRHPIQPKRTYYHPTMQRIVDHDHRALTIHWSPMMLEYLTRNFATMLNNDLAEWLGVSPRTVVRKARQLGLTKNKAWLDGIWNERRKMAHSAAKKKGYPGAFRKGVHNSPSTEFKQGHIPANKKKANNDNV